MARAFSQIAYTEPVRAAQALYGSRDANNAFDRDPDPGNTLTERERAFISSVDTFFIATVGANGWPYVQHRGGPAGFLKVLDERTLGFADFSGNRQYITAGNVMHDDRVALILINFRHRERLKVWGRARIVHEHERPELIARLEVPTYRARVERGYLITVEALDFNCPQHITPRYTHEEVGAMIGAPRAAIAGRATADRSAPTAQSNIAPLGRGPLELRVTGVRVVAPRIRAYELRRPDGDDLPRASAGAHIALPYQTPGGHAGMRTYSIASDPARRDAYEVAVLLQEDGAGGSGAIHRDYAIGTALRCPLPRNAFPLHDDERPAVLIAGGIGITPIKAMAHALLARGASFRVHYAARSQQDAAYAGELGALLPASRLHLHFSDRARSRLNLERIFEEAPGETVFYACGPARLLEAYQRIAHQRGIAAERIRFERFSAPPTPDADRPVIVELQRSQKTIIVPADTSILDAANAAGATVRYECRMGTCGTCATKVIDGEPDHRDSVLTDAERSEAMCICVSRGRSQRLALDL